MKTKQLIVAQSRSKRHKALKRGKLLYKRLVLLNRFLLQEKDTGKTFSVFLKERKLTEDRFLYLLPKDYQLENIGSKYLPFDEKELINYTTKLNDLYYNQYKIYEKEKIVLVPSVKYTEFSTEPNEFGISEVVCIDDGSEYEDFEDIEDDFEDIDDEEYADDDDEDKYADDDGEEYADDDGEEYADDDEEYADDDEYEYGRGRARRKAKKAARKAKKAARKAKRKAKKAARKAKRKAKKPKKGKKGLHILNKMNPLFVTGRNSFLLIVKLNVRNLAFNMGRVKDEGGARSEKLDRIWYNLGGMPKALHKAIQQGRNKKPLLGKSKKMEGMDGIDEYKYAVPVAAVLASAATILAAIMPILKSFKKDKGESIDDEETEVPEGAEAPPGIEGEGEEGSGEEGSGEEGEGIIGIWDKYKYFIIGIPLSLAALLGIIAAIKAKKK